MVRKISQYNLNFLKFTETWFVTQNVIYPGDYSMCTWEKSVFCFWGWNVLKTTIRCIRTDVWFKGCASLLILFQDDLSIGVNGVLQSPTIIVLKSISFLMVIAISLCIDIEVFLCWVYKYLYCYISFWIDPLIIM